MLSHFNKQPVSPKRVVILGAGGFVGGAALRLLESAGVSCLALTRKEVDLLAPDAAKTLRGKLQAGDSLLVTSAMAPCKNRAMLSDNIRMMDAVCEAIEQTTGLAQIVYISSDAVYADSAEPLTETSCASPDGLHGIMHVAREVMLADAAGEIPLALLRPTLIYGFNDPHNGYGPNRFRRLAADGEDIVLFGEGEERRDHVLIDDVAELARRVLFHRSQGILNVAVGEVMSFREIAEMVAGSMTPRVVVRGTTRQGTMPHGGYRPFSSEACRLAFPDFSYTELKRGLDKVLHESLAEI